MKLLIRVGLALTLVVGALAATPQAALASSACDHENCKPNCKLPEEGRRCEYGYTSTVTYSLTPVCTKCDNTCVGTMKKIKTTHHKCNGGVYCITVDPYGNSSGPC